jgi:hypothetical protein
VRQPRAPGASTRIDRGRKERLLLPGLPPGMPWCRGATPRLPWAASPGRPAPARAPRAAHPHSFTHPPLRRCLSGLVQVCGRRLAVQCLLAAPGCPAGGRAGEGSSGRPPAGDRLARKHGARQLEATARALGEDAVLAGPQGPLAPAGQQDVPCPWSAGCQPACGGGRAGERRAGEGWRPGVLPPPPAEGVQATERRRAGSCHAPAAAAARCVGPGGRIHRGSRTAGVREGSLLGSQGPLVGSQGSLVGSQGSSVA